MRIIPLDTPAEALLDPDLAWDGRIGDLVTTPLDDPLNPGALRNGQALATAILICLMTDRRVEPLELPDGESNRGWPGDSFDLADGETPLGSKLWLLRRRGLTEGIELEAQDHAREALQTLVDQGVVARFDVTAVADRAAGRLTLSVAAFRRDGTIVHDSKFAVLWDQIDGVSNPLA